MIKKWMIAAIAYLLIVMAGYGIYATTVQTDTTPQHNGEVNH